MTADLTGLTEALRERDEMWTRQGVRSVPSAFVETFVAPLLAEREAQARREGAAEELHAAADHATTEFTELLTGQDVIDSLRRRARRIRVSAVSGEPTCPLCEPYWKPGMSHTQAADARALARGFVGTSGGPS